MHPKNLKNKPYTFDWNNKSNLCADQQPREREMSNSHTSSCDLFTVRSYTILLMVWPVATYRTIGRHRFSSSSHSICLRLPCRYLAFSATSQTTHCYHWTYWSDQASRSRSPSRSRFCFLFPGSDQCFASLVSSWMFHVLLGFFSLMSHLHTIRPLFESNSVTTFVGIRLWRFYY